MAKKQKAEKVEAKATKEVTIQTLSALLQGRQTELPKTEKKTVSTSTWRGTLTFGLVSFPVKCYKAADEEKIAFNQIHSTCRTQLKQQDMFCPTCDASVPDAEIAKGYKVGEKFVVVTAEEIAAQHPLSDKIMSVTEFVPAEQVDALYYAGAQYLTPDKGGEKPFALLRAGMLATQTVAVSRRVERGREQTLIIRPYGTNGMVLHYMYFEHEIRNCEKWKPYLLNEKEVEIASLLIKQLTDDFRPETKFDSFIVSTKKLIEDKLAGKQITPAEKVTLAAPETDLMAALLASVKSTEGRKAVRRSA